MLNLYEHINGQLRITRYMADSTTMTPTLNSCNVIFSYSLYLTGLRGEGDTASVFKQRYAEVRKPNGLDGVSYKP